MNLRRVALTLASPTHRRYPDTPSAPCVDPLCRIIQAMRPDLPSGSVTFLFTDVEGSTKLLQELGTEGYAGALAEHRKVLREAFNRYGGIEVDTQGDAFFVAFPTAPGALEAAAKALKGLAAGPIRVRMGIHSGTPHLADEGYVGLDVHRAARIAACGHGGQVLVSASSARLLDTSQLQLLGEHRLKDFEEPIALYQLGEEVFPPLKTISNTNLPRPASSFVGRENDVQEITSLLHDGVRLLTLTGPGGSGKTRLAIEAAAELVPAFKSGVLWVGLVALRDPELVAETIAQTLGAKDGLAEHIGERELLLLLDNLEQVVEAAPELAALVETCVNLRLLVTSRELLQVRGEVEYPVLPLADPEAVELFCERARTEPDEAVHQLCRALDNLPLALELAAARASVLSPKQILERLSGRLDLFRGGRDAEPRQHTLRATIAWSYELLTKQEQSLFARVSVFRDGCTLDAAEEVADADLDTLQSLVDKSLLRRSDERFWMLETIREYATERLDASGEAERLRRRHAEWFLALAEEAEPNMVWYSAEWNERLEREHDNLRAALDWLGASGEGDLALRLAGALQGFWGHGHVPEARRRLERILAGNERPTIARAKALDALAEMAYRSDDTAAAAALEEDALQLYRRLGDVAGAASVLVGLGVCYVELGDPERARRFCQEGIELFRQVGDDRSAVAATRTLAFTYDSSGDKEHAIELHEANLREIQALGFKQMEAATLGSLWSLAVERGRADDARSFGMRSLELWRQVGSLDGIAQALCHAAEQFAHLLGKAETAAQLLSWFEAQHEQIGVGEAWVVRLNERTLAAIQANLDDAAIAEAWGQGAKLTVDEAVALALDAMD